MSDHILLDVWLVMILTIRPPLLFDNAPLIRFLCRQFPFQFHFVQYNYFPFQPPQGTQHVLPQQN